MLKILKQNGFASLTEVIITAIIFIIATYGILTSLSQIRGQGRISTKRVEAAYLGKSIIDNLRSAITQPSWEATNGPFVVGQIYNYPMPAGSPYTVTYTFVDAPTGMKQILLNVTYPDQ